MAIDGGDRGAAKFVLQLGMVKVQNDITLCIAFAFSENDFRK